MAYLVDHPPRVRQFKERGTPPSGVVVMHTAESFPDEVGPDTGAENVAAFIASRTNFGSYHGLADSDSELVLVPFHMQAYGDGTGSNPHAYHASAATQAAKWRHLSAEWTDATLRNLAKNVARYAKWLKKVHGIEIPARRITREESDRRVPGFLSHADRDPDRRTDPGADFDWVRFFRYYSEAMGHKSEPEPKTVPTRGELVDSALGKVNSAVKDLKATKASSGSPREEQLVQALASTKAARTAIRDVKIFQMKVEE